MKRYFISKTMSDPQIHRHSVLQVFVKWANVAKWFGFFPLRARDVTNIRQNGGQSSRPFASFTNILSLPLIYCSIIYVLSSMFIVFPMRVYISDYIEKDLTTELQTTDRFALQTFLVCIHLIRVTAPFLTIYKYSSIMNIIRRLQRYDEKYRIQPKKGTKFIDWSIITLFTSCILVILSNFVASKVDFIEFIIQSNKMSWILELLSFKNKYVGSILVKVSHAHAEFSTAFLIAAMRFISKFIDDRVQELSMQLQLQETEIALPRIYFENRKNLLQQQQHHHQYLSLPDVRHEYTSSVSVPMYKEKVCENTMVLVNMQETKCQNLELSRFKNLHEIVGLFNFTFRSCILNFFVLTTILSIVSIYMIVMMLRYVSIGGGLHVLTKMRFLRGFNVMGITGFHSIFRTVLLINVGERIQMAGKNLLTAVSVIDVTNLTEEHSAKVKQIRWMLHGCHFAVKPWNIFTLNRRVAVSILGCVTTFVVVLTQFRASDSQYNPMVLMSEENQTTNITQ